MYGQQEFGDERHGSTYTAVITVGCVLGKPLLQAVLNWKNGFGGGSRRLTSQFLGEDDAARVTAGLRGEMPRWALADVLQDLGLDDGVTQTVRGEDMQ